MNPTMGGNFSDNPIIYHVITDRFNRSGARPGLEVEDAGGLRDIGTYHGGTFAGISEKLREGWFGDLGINAIWITAPYEQISGWVPGTNGEFRHFPYHGYWALDYTMINDSFGSLRDLKDLVDIAHSLGIKVLFDIAISHPGYPDLATFGKLLPGAVKEGWGNASATSYYDFFGDDDCFLDWWGPDWVRAKLPGYETGGQDELTTNFHNLPRFKTDCDAHVALPAFLRNKVETQARDLPETSVRGYLIKWLSDWVQLLGVDGFRCDSAKHVGTETWLELRHSASQALTNWKSENPESFGDNAPFWMLGEVFGHGIERSKYHDSGFDAVLNFDFQDEIAAILNDANMKNRYSRSLAIYRLDRLFDEYATTLQGSPACSFVSYISSHDTYLFDREMLMYASVALLMAPGGIQILYGDETARPAGEHTPGDPVQQTRSDMNWASMNIQVLKTWKLLGKFRARHIAVARGRHRKLSEDPYVFVRENIELGDRVIISLGHDGSLELEVDDIFDEGESLIDAYSGRRAVVSQGRIAIDVDGIMLLEREVAT